MCHGTEFGPVQHRAQRAYMTLRTKVCSTLAAAAAVRPSAVEHGKIPPSAAYQPTDGGRSYLLVPLLSVPARGYSFVNFSRLLHGGTRLQHWHEYCEKSRSRVLDCLEPD
jgi:hypothetical protein